MFLIKLKPWKLSYTSQIYCIACMIFKHTLNLVYSYSPAYYLHRSCYILIYLLRLYVLYLHLDQMLRCPICKVHSSVLLSQIKALR